MSAVTFVSTVGSKNVPASACRLPPVATCAPRLVASAMCASTFSTAAASISGPCVTPASVPDPTFSAFTRSTSFEANAS
jgi:hypothetical protein